MQSLRSFAAIGVLLIAFSSCGQAPIGGPPVLPAPGTSPAIFEQYDASGNSKLASSWTRNLDLSGVSFNDPRTLTLITPRHVLMAKHFPRTTGTPVIFHDRAGKRIERKLIGIRSASGDISIGLLDAALPSNYTPYKLPTIASSSAALTGRPVLITDQFKNVYVHQVAAPPSAKITFRHDPNEKYGWSRNLVTGDSGNPSFLIVGKELVLIETHSTGGPGAGPYFGNATVQASIRSAVAALDPSFAIQTLLIP